MRKQAEVKIILTVEFDDNGEDDLIEQAFDAAKEMIPDEWEAEWEVLGPVKDKLEPLDLCKFGVHSWSDATVKLPPETECTRCGELYGDPE